jgi:hypothetical protein
MQIIDLQDKDTKAIFANDKCVRCGEKFILNRYMVQNGLFSFHLTCFKKDSENKIKEHEKEVNIIKQCIEQLKPYSKDMICEVLLKEKYG